MVVGIALRWWWRSLQNDSSVVGLTTTISFPPSPPYCFDFGRKNLLHSGDVRTHGNQMQAFLLHSSHQLAVALWAHDGWSKAGFFTLTYSGGIPASPSVSVDYVSGVGREDNELALLLWTAFVQIAGDVVASHHFLMPATFCFARLCTLCCVWRWPILHTLLASTGWSSYKKHISML